MVSLNAFDGKRLPICVLSNQIRDRLFFEDHARALVAATAGEIGETDNIGGHNEKQNIEVVQTICTILNELRPLDHQSQVTSHSLPTSPIALVHDMC